MFNLIFVLIFALLGGVCLYIPVEEVNFIGYVLFSLSVVWLIASSINCLSSFSSQLHRFEKLHSKLNNLKRYKGIQLELVKEFKFYLGEKFPDLEKELYKNITSNLSDINIVLKYPEIKSSDVLVKLTKEISESIRTVYELEKRIEEDCADIRYYKNGKWEIVKPSIPENIKKFVYNEIEI